LLSEQLLASQEGLYYMGLVY